MTKLNASVLLACLTLLFSGVALADGTQIYKWTDSQGVVHYSDKAPAKTPELVTLMSLSEFPPADPKAAAEEQAYIAFVNQWYQNLMQQQSQQQYEQFLAWEQSQPVEPAAPPVEQVSYVTPCWSCGFGSHFHHHRFRPPLLSPPTPQSFHTSLWSTQPNLFTQSLYKP